MNTSVSTHLREGGRNAFGNIPSGAYVFFHTAALLRDLNSSEKEHPRTLRWIRKNVN